jgi:DNA-directed RNA polymerase specialized sigma24 family protein
MRDLSRRALEDLQRGIDEFDPSVFDGPDPVIDELFSGACLRALSAARDDLNDARAAYATAVSQARIAGFSWGEIGAVLGVSKQVLHRRFRSR